MTFADLRKKHLAEVLQALNEADDHYREAVMHMHELEVERARLLELKRLYEAGERQNGAALSPPVDKRQMALPTRPSQKIVRREAILVALREAGDAGLHDYPLGDRVRNLGAVIKHDPKRPRRSGLDYDLADLQKAGIIERCAPATWRLTPKGKTDA